MVIKFDLLKETVIPNFHGGEKETSTRMFTDGNNKIMYGKLESGASIGLHTHETSSEIIYILQGNGKVLYDGELETVMQGVCHYCPKGHAHSLINDSADVLIFFAVVPEQ
ncbi:MAG: cupin domain-containing protein [Lachnospiraceae bacterium]